MPAVITHYLHAKQVAERLEKRSGVKLYMPAVYWGAQGPDFLYFHRAVPVVQPGRSYRKLGSRLHRENPEKLFRLMYSYYLTYGAGRKHLLSFIYGFLCHYSLDRIAHPYIYGRQTDFIRRDTLSYNPSYMHNKIETSLDVILLARMENIQVAEFNPAGIFQCDQPLLASQSELMAYVINEMFSRSISAGKLTQAFLDMERNLNCLYDPSARKLAFVRAAENLFHLGPALSGMMRDPAPDDYDYPNRAHEIWTNPAAPSQERREDFFELFESAVEDACTLISRFGDAVLTRKWRGNLTDGIGFLLGVPVEQGCQAPAKAS